VLVIAIIGVCFVAMKLAVQSCDMVMFLAEG